MSMHLSDWDVVSREEDDAGGMILTEKLEVKGGTLYRTIYWPPDGNPVMSMTSILSRD